MEEEFLEDQQPRQRYISGLVTVLLVLTVALCLYMVVQVLSKGYASIGGVMMFRVVTGSMEPTIPTGALMMARQVDIHSIVENDIICFRSQETQIWGKIVTHRVVEVLQSGEGRLLLETRGDANLVSDVYYVTSDNFVGKVIWYTGEGNMLASVFSFFTNKIGFLACIVFPCLLLAALILKDCVKNIRGELAEALRELEEPEQTDPMLSMTPEEYEEMYQRIRAELIKELMEGAQVSQTE